MDVESKTSITEEREREKEKAREIVTDFNVISFFHLEKKAELGPVFVSEQFGLVWFFENLLHIYPNYCKIVKLFLNVHKCPLPCLVTRVYDLGNKYLVAFNNIHLLR